jgi:hypothetical protein
MVRVASLSTKAFFSFQQMRDIEEAIFRMEDVGIYIKAFRALEKPLFSGGKGKADDQYRSFMGLGKLWRVVRTVISIAYIDKLIAGQLFLQDRQGNTYKLVLHTPAREPWVPPADLVGWEEEDKDDIGG